jgi:hypothetical protein
MNVNNDSFDDMVSKKLKCVTGVKVFSKHTDLCGVVSY